MGAATDDNTNNISSATSGTSPSIFITILQWLKLFWWFLEGNWLGAKWSIIEIFSKHKPFDINSIPKRTGDTAVITGGTKGIGVEVIRKLLECDMHVIIGCRKIEAGNAVIETIRKSGISSGSSECLQLDLMSLTSVRAFAKTILDKNQPIHLLLNNAGIMAVPYKVTEDSFESQFQVNYFSHFVLTKLLLPRLIDGGNNTNGRASRIVNTSSIAQFPGDVDFDDLQKEKLYSETRAYEDSKLFQVISSNCLNRKLKNQGVNVRSYSLHPGVIPTDLWEYSWCYVRLFVSCFTPLFRTAEQAAQLISFIGLSPEVDSEGGVFYVNREKYDSNPLAEDTKIQDKLWEVSLKLASLESTDNI